MTVLVTGASGFVGRHVIAELRRRSIRVRAAGRVGSPVTLSVDGTEILGLSGAGFAEADWTDVVAGCEAVIHLAGRAHVVQDTHEDPAQAFYMANVDFARSCAAAAVSAGVRRFIFISSVGVHGGASGTLPVNASSALAPHTRYARSKAEAELVLNEVVRASSMTLTVLRPPLVYGTGAPGNFGSLVRAVARGWPMPLGGVNSNRRSLVAIDNLVDLIMTCLDHPSAENETFLVSDGEDLSTADLVRRLGIAMGKPARLLPVPVELLSMGARLLGKPDLFQSLCGSLQVDIGKTRGLLGWSPPISVDEGLKRAVAGIRC